VLILEASQHLASEIVNALAEAAPGAHVEIAQSLEEAQRLVLNVKPDLFVLDVDATYDLGQEFLYDLRTSHPNARAIILTAIHLAAHREQAKGLGAIHFLEKPFPRADFTVLVQALLDPSSVTDGEKFQGTLSDLHIADIVQLKCMSGSTSVLEFTGPSSEKARIFFENGQVRHAIAPGKEGIPAFNEIVNWKGGMISEVSGAPPSPKTIDLDWQMLLMEAVREIDETRSIKKVAAESKSHSTTTGKVLVIDDSLMLLSFVKEILSEANYRVATAPTAAEGLEASMADPPDLILLDYVLPDLKGDEVSRRLMKNSATKDIPVLYMSGLGTDLDLHQLQTPNVIGSLNKPFTSQTLLKTIETHLSKSTVKTAEAASAEVAKNEAHLEKEPIVEKQLEPGQGFVISEMPTAFSDPGSAAESTSSSWSSSEATSGAQSPDAPRLEPESFSSPSVPQTDAIASSLDTATVAPPFVPPDSSPFFSGDTSFFSLYRALQTITKEKLSGVLRCFWSKATVELLAQRGRIVLVTTNDPGLYCPELPATLGNVDPAGIDQARGNQAETGCPIFLRLAQAGLIPRESGAPLVQHHGQKLFAHLWVARRVRFVFEQRTELPDYAGDFPAEEDVDQWSLSTLRFLQYQDLTETRPCDFESVPAYTRDGFARVQNLRLTVAEAQFASQFNGIRSIQQIAKNLRLDLKLAGLTLFRFLALEIVECWPSGSVVKTERRGLFQRFGFGG